MLWSSSFRYLKKHPFQVLLSVIGVALGVAVVVGIDLSIQSASRAFEISTDQIAGRTTHRIVGSSGNLSDSLYARLKRRPPSEKAAPVIEQSVYVPAINQQLQLMGVDPFAEAPFRPYLSSLRAGGEGRLQAFLTHPSGVLISQNTAQELGKRTGDSLEVRIEGKTAQLIILGVLEGRDRHSRQMMEDLLIADLATAQRILNMKGRLSYIDVIIPEGPRGKVVKNRIRSSLPEGVELRRSKARPSAIEKMISAFNTNLQSLSFLALVVGMFLIYNTMTFSVLQRRRQIGRLQAIGVTRGEIFRLVLAEAGVIGIVGTSLGIGVGYFLGGGLVTLVTQTINDIYFSLSVQQVYVNGWILLKALLLGVGATLLTATIPAREATRSSARMSLQRSSVERRLQQRLPLITVIGGICLILGGAILLYPSKHIVLGYLGLLPVMVGYALLVPVCVVGLTNLCRGTAGKMAGMPGRMAVENIKDQLSRSSVAIAALCIAVAATIGVTTSISSFRKTVENWLQYRLQSDVFVSAQGNVSRREARTFSPDIAEKIRASKGVSEVHTLLRVPHIYNQSIVDLEAVNISREGWDRYRLKEGERSEAWRKFKKGQILVSEPFAFDHQLSVADSIRLQTARGTRMFQIAGVFYDYSSDIGTILMSRETFQRYWNRDRITSLSIVAAEGWSAEQLTEHMEKKLAKHPVTIRSNRELRQLSMKIFNRTFSVTRVLELLTVLIALVGVFSALLALQMERRREIGILRAIGFTPGQIRGIMIGQTGFMGAFAGLLALPLGFLLALVLVYVINKRSFGWTLQLSFSWEILLQAMIIAVGAALLSGIYPAIRMAGMNVVRALREE